MRSLSRTYALLTIITALAFYVIGCVGLEWFPTIGYCSNAHSINTVLLNLSYSYLASIIFYIVIDLVPRWSNEHRAFEIFKKDLSSAYMHMNKMVGIFKMMAGTEKSNEQLTKDDFSSLNICKSSFRDSIVEMTYGKGREEGEIDCYAFLKYHANHLRSTLNSILELPASTMLERELVTLLIETKKAEVVSICTNRLKSVIADEHDFPINEFDIKIADFIELYLKWGKYLSRPPQYHYALPSSGNYELIENKIRTMLSATILNKVDIEGISETHCNKTFLCFYALPEKYKGLISNTRKNNS